MQKHIVRLLTVVIIVVGTVGCDQGTKIVARKTLPLYEKVSVVGDYFILIHAENRGAFLSLGENFAPGLRTVLFGALPLLIVVGIAGYLLVRRPASPAQAVALSLVLGGGIGNLIDRLARGGYVTDFMNAGIGNHRIGIFNFADLFLMAGIALFLLLSIRESRQKQAPSDPTAGS